MSEPPAVGPDRVAQMRWEASRFTPGGSERTYQRKWEQLKVTERAHMIAEVQEILDIAATLRRDEEAA